MPWLKSKPTELPSPMRAPPNSAMPVTVIAGPSTDMPWRAELVAPRVLHAQLVQHACCRCVDTSCAEAESIRSVKSVARSVVVRPPPMFDGEKFLKQEVAHRQQAAGVELVVGLAEREVHLLVRRDDAARRQRDAERLRRRPASR